MRKTLAMCICCVLFSLCLTPAALATGKPPLDISLKRIYAATYDQDGSMLEYPYLTANDPSLSSIAEKINAQIAREAHIPEYTQLLSALRGGGTGLEMRAENVTGPDAHNGKGYLSCLITVRGKMLSGPPSQVNYPLVFDLNTGERVSFDQVFSDAEGARARIEQYLTDEIEPQLSTYLENNALLPVPFEQFAFSSNGLITFYYDHSQFSFLSGNSGAVSFRYSELWDWLDLSPEGIALSMVSDGNGTHQYWYAAGQEADPKAIFSRECCGGVIPGCWQLFRIGGTVALLKDTFSVTMDSGYYPGGACLEMEEPQLRGTWVLTDESETVITGYLSSRVDAYGIETGKTSLDSILAFLGEPAARMPMDENTAQQYLVCPGQALIYPYQDIQGHDLINARCTLYLDENQILQYIKVECSETEID